MIIRLLDKGDEGELLLEGSLNDTCADDAGRIFNDLSERFTNVILNMALLDDVSPSGLVAIKQLNIRLRQKGGSLLLRNVNPIVTEVLQVTGYAGSLKLEKNNDSEKGSQR